jgi:hypothetical protein
MAFAETCVIVDRKDVKRALLLFDRVNDHRELVLSRFSPRTHQIFSNYFKKELEAASVVPEELRKDFVFSSAAGKKRLESMYLNPPLRFSGKLTQEEAFKKDEFIRRLSSLSGSFFDYDWEKEKAIDDTRYALATAIAYREMKPVLGYRSSCDFESDFPDGGNVTRYIAVLENLNVVSNDELEWEQVVEFRSDTPSRDTYRNALRKWLTSASACESIEQAKETVEKMLEGYDNTVKKFGLKTKKANWSLVTDLLAQETIVVGAGMALSSASPTLGMVAPAVSAIVAGAFTVKAISAHCFEHKLNLAEVKETPGKELALIFEAREFVKNINK